MDVLVVVAFAVVAPSPKVTLSLRPPLVARLPGSASPGLWSRAQVVAEQFSTRYEQVSRESYLSLAAVQAGVLGGCSDAASQAMLLGSARTIDTHHVAALACLAAVLSGCFNAKWLAMIEQAVPGSSTRAVVTKSVADFFIAGTLANSAYLVGVPLLTATLAGTPADPDVFSGWTPEGFRSVMLLELCTFGPYNLFAFRAVPPQLRPLTAAGALRPQPYSYQPFLRGIPALCPQASPPPVPLASPPSRSALAADCQWHV